MSDDDLDRRMRKLAIDHAEVRWMALRLGDTAIDLREELGAVKATQETHTSRLDSIDRRLHSLTQMVGQVLDRLPEK